MRLTASLLVTFLLTSGLGLAASAEKGWMTDFEAARKKAAELERPILVDFTGSDWCGWCIKLDREVFSKKAFQTYADKNLVLFVADFPRSKKQSDEVKEQNQALAEKYRIQGFPTILLVDEDGKVLARTGYRPGGADAYVDHIGSLLENGKS